MAKTSTKLEQAFLAAYDEYADSLFRFIYYKVHQSKDVAHDLLQDTFCKVWKAIGQKGEMVEHAQAFLYKTARNLIIDHSRKKSTSEIGIEEDFDIESKEESIESILDVQFSMEQVTHAMKQLPDQYIEIIHLRFIEEKTIDEISELLESSHNAISVKIHRALSRLKKVAYEKS